MKRGLMPFARNWVRALLPPVATLAGAWALAAGPTLEPEGAPPLSATLSARGVQIYECRNKAGSADAYEWAFVAPQAELFDARGRRVGSHGAGPHWLADDGSRVEGRVLARQDAALPGAIPWLLLQAQASGGTGLFSHVGHIQRINTLGGIAPADGCRRETLGQTARVAYSADYRFFDKTQP
jgi:Protein of unknown function (DUF3455)